MWRREFFRAPEKKKMRENMKKILFAAVAAVGIMLCGCGNNSVVSEFSAPQNQGKKATRSIYVYMSGGDAEAEYGSATESLKEMIKADIADNVNIVVQTGGSTGWHDANITAGKTERFEVHKGGLQKIASMDNENMGSANTLLDFLNWGNEKYPADDRILIIWGQGGGAAGGTAYDANYEYDSLTSGEIAYALGKSGVNYSMIGFDSCLSASLENAAAIAPYAEFMTASEDFQPCGWAYDKWLKYVYENPTASSDKIAGIICDSYYNKCVDMGQEDFCTASVIDLSKISELKQAFDGAVNELCNVPDSPERYREYALDMTDVHKLGGKNESEGFSNMVDLCDFISQTSQNDISTAVTSAVIHNVAGKLVPYASGIGMFYPVHQNADELNKYFDITPSSYYKKFLRMICTKAESTEDEVDYTVSKAWKDYLNERGYFKSTSLVANNRYELNISGNMDIVKKVALNMYKYDEASGKYLYVDDYFGMDINRPGGIYKDNGDVTGVMLNGVSITSYLVDKGEDYNLYSLPVYIDGVQGNIRVAVKNGKKSKVYGFRKCINPLYGSASRNVRKIYPMTKFESFSRAYNSDEYYKTAERYAGFMKFKNEPLEEGEYKLEYKITDVYDEEQILPPSDMTVSGKTALKH